MQVQQSEQTSFEDVYRQFANRCLSIKSEDIADRDDIINFVRIKARYKEIDESGYRTLQDQFEANIEAQKQQEIQAKGKIKSNFPTFNEYTPTVEEITAVAASEQSSIMVVGPHATNLSLTGGKFDIRVTTDNPAEGVDLWQLAKNLSQFDSE